MGMDAHGWNFFMSLYDTNEGTEPFLVHKVLEEREIGNTTSRVVEYQDLFVECTDYSEATDNLEHEIAQTIAVPWMKRCGIPDFLQKIVVRATMRPKRIEFNGKGLFSQTGEETNREGIRFVTLLRGVLMGDPLTKVILHVLNISVRESGNLILDKSFWKEINGLMWDNPPKESTEYRPRDPQVLQRKVEELSKFFAQTKDAVELKRRADILLHRNLIGEDGHGLNYQAGYIQRPIETLGPSDYKVDEGVPIGAAEMPRIDESES